VNSSTDSIVKVVDYQPDWPAQFRILCDSVWPLVADLAIAIEHVGSTSVTGMAAKPVIDLDIVTRSRDEIPAVAMRLAQLGYRYLGNLGVEDREAFRAAKNEPAHNLYVCPSNSIALRNHIAFRNHLRAHAEDAAAYAALKRQLAERFSRDINRYAEAKTDFVLSILARYGLSSDCLDSIRRANSVKPAPLLR
jgi:GrpB-like predicted nucleotidyltransferase (UPF0157 family)